MKTTDHFYLVNTFYRPVIPDLKEFDAICYKLRKDLSCVMHAYAGYEELGVYTMKLIDEGRDFENRGILLWDLEDVKNVCREGFIAYVAEPTRIAAAILVNVQLVYPEVAGLIPHFTLSLEMALKGAAACGFSGHGYDADRYLVKTMAELTEWNIPYFLEHYECFEFWQQFSTQKAYIRDKVATVENPNWFIDKKLVADAKALLKNIDASASGEKLSWEEK